MTDSIQDETIKRPVMYSNGKLGPMIVDGEGLSIAVAAFADREQQALEHIALCINDHERLVRENNDFRIRLFGCNDPNHDHGAECAEANSIANTYEDHARLTAENKLLAEKLERYETCGRCGATLLPPVEPHCIDCLPNEENHPCQT